MKLYSTPDDYFHFLSYIKPAESYSKLTRLHSHSAHSIWVEEGKEGGGRGEHGIRFLISHYLPSQKPPTSNSSEWWETKKQYRVSLSLKEFSFSTWWILFDKRIKRCVVSRGSCWGSHGLHNRQSTSYPHLLSPPCFFSSTWLKWKDTDVQFYSNIFF